MTVKLAEPVQWGPASATESDCSLLQSCPQTVAAVAPDGRPARPNRLPLTSECGDQEKIAYELPSPTAVSLNGGDVTPELTSCKSSSAPHLIKSTQTLPRTRYDGSQV